MAAPYGRPSVLARCTYSAAWSLCLRTPHSLAFCVRPATTLVAPASQFPSIPLVRPLHFAMTYADDTLAGLVAQLRRVGALAKTANSATATDDVALATDLADLRDRYHALSRAERAELWEMDVSVRTVAKVARLIAVQDWGLQFLVALRGEMLNHAASATVQSPPSMGSALAVLKRQIQTTLLPALELSEVTRASDPRLLRAVLQYETVHPLSSLDDLHRRLLPSRRIVALTHPHLVDPLAILQIALSPGPDPPGSIQALLSDPHAGADPAEPTAPAATATFYSVNSTMRGLSGIDMGTRIIKMGVTWIQAEWPSVRTFSTLSPIPTFKAWAMAHWDRADVLREVPPSTRALVVRTFGSWERFRSVVARGKWAADPAQQRFVKEVMQPVCKAYLENVRRDPVFRFHLGNGAIAWRLNFLGDTSVKGMHQSLSFMVNYLYDLDHLDENARAFRSPHRIVKSRL